jgi:serine/threonine protein kinase
MQILADRSDAQRSARLPPGTRLNGIYEIDQHLSAGGMGEIYKGHEIESGDPVAIKVLRSDLADDETALALFRKEAKALRSVHHEAIVRYYVFSDDPGIGRHYLAMEFVHGQRLSDIIQRCRLAFDQVRQLQQRIAAALHEAHRNGIIHRDVSPDNVLVPDGDVGRAKIIDFGIARSTRSDDTTIIGTGFAGKYNYVSPEQIGLFGPEVTAKSDIYSLGLVLAECLLGQPIDMRGSEFEVVEKRRVVPDLHAVDPRFQPLLAQMLQPDPKDRPESMAEVAGWQPAGEALPTSRAWAPCRWEERLTSVADLEECTTKMEVNAPQDTDGSRPDVAAIAGRSNRANCAFHQRL